MERDLDRVLDGGLLNTMDVTLRYVDVAAGITFDRNVEGSYPAREEKEIVLPALVHFFGAKTQELTGGEILAGDASVVFRHDAALDGKDLQCLVIDGRKYAQKSTGRHLVEDWDVIVGGQRYARTLLVTRRD